jgi:hypothetical protein
MFVQIKSSSSHGHPVRGFFPSKREDCRQEELYSPSAKAGDDRRFSKAALARGSLPGEISVVLQASNRGSRQACPKQGNEEAQGNHHEG